MPLSFLSVRAIVYVDFLSEKGDVMESKTYFLSVETPNGIVELEVYHAVVNQDEEDVTVTISTTVQDEKVVLQADTTEEALIQLAKSFPAGWNIKSCLSCRYGHFCPVGDYDNELLCVTEFEVKTPRDLWHVTENIEERAKRSRTLFDLCDRYLLQSNGYFTYSDYYFRMNNAKFEE